MRTCGLREAPSGEDSEHREEQTGDTRHLISKEASHLGSVKQMTKCLTVNTYHGKASRSSRKTKAPEVSQTESGRFQGKHALPMVPPGLQQS